MDEKDEKDEFLETIDKYRKAKQKDVWKGTFLEYLELVKKNPQIVKSASARIHEMIATEGKKIIDNEQVRRIFGAPLTAYNFFHDFYGIETTIEEIVNFFKAASSGLEASRQVLYLMGPVGSGKSSLVSKLMSGLSRSGPIYVLDGCPMFEEPLHLIPEGLRDKFEKELGVKIEGDLCPACRYRLKEEFKNGDNVEYERFPVTTIEFSKRARRGLVSLPPVDPNSQDITELIGAEDISKLHKLELGDPRLTLLIGAFNKGNRGIVEFIEIFENESEYLQSMLTATQEKVISAPGKQSMISVDLVIIGHSNEPQWRKFTSNPEHVNYLDRIVKINVPYTLELSEEVKIYQKLLSMSKFKDAKISPHSLEMAGKLAILSRLEPSNKADLMTKLKLYNGELIIERGGTKKISIKELKEEALAKEGMFGLSTRFIEKAIDGALIKSEHNCLNPISVRESLMAAVEKGDFPDDEKKKLLAFLTNMLHKDFLQILEKEIVKAGVHAFDEQAQALFDNYIDHAEAFVNKTKVKDSVTDEELEPDEVSMRSIEEQLGLSGDAAKGFRQDVISFCAQVWRRKQVIDWKSYAPLKQAIENKIMAATSEFVRVVMKSRARDQKEVQKYSEIVRQMKTMGYECDHCIDVILKFAHNHLWRD